MTKGLKTKCAAISVAILVINLPITDIASATSPEEVADKIQTTIGCSAYAFIQTGDYPETDKVYFEKKLPSNAAEKARARTGMIWTNRVFFVGQVAATLLNDAAGRAVSNGEFSALQKQLVSQIRDLSASQKNAMFALCKPLYAEADKYCLANRCVDKP